MAGDVNGLVNRLCEFLEERTGSEIDPAVPLSAAGIDSLSMSELLLEMEARGYVLDRTLRSDGFRWEGLSLQNLVELIVDSARAT